MKITYFIFLKILQQSILQKAQPLIKSRHQRSFLIKGVLRNFAKFTGKHLCQSLFFNKVAALRPTTLLKRRPWHRCFPVNFTKFLEHLFCRTPLGDCLPERLWSKYLSLGNASYEGLITDS